MPDTLEDTKLDEVDMTLPYYEDTVEYIEEQINNPSSTPPRTHIVNPPNNTHIWEPGMTSQDVVDIARTHGLEVKALCGYTWVPKRNPEKYDVCETCMQIAGQLMRDSNE